MREIRGVPPTETEAKSLNIRELLSSVEYDKEGAPKLEVDEGGKKQLERLFNSLSRDGINVVAVIRCWNKDPQQLAEVLARLQKLQASIPELRGAIISINSEADRVGTSQIVNSVSQLSAFPMAPVNIEGYSWTSGLNGPAAVLNRFCQENRLDPKNQRIFNLSFDTVFIPEEADKLGRRIRDNKPVISVRIGDREFDRDVHSRTIKSIKNLIIQGEKIEGGITPFILDNKVIGDIARNTGMVWNLDDIVKLGGFRNITNGFKGMEDHDLGARLLLDALQKKEYGKVKEILRAMKDEPVVYTDLVWQRLLQSKIKNPGLVKLHNEIDAITSIVSNLSAINQGPQSVNRWVAPEENRDFKF